MLFFDFSLLGDILQYALGSFILGVVLTILFVFLLFLLIKGFYPKSTFSPLSIITGLVLTILLIPQMIQLCGAVALKAETANISEWLDENIVHSDRYIIPQDISTEESTEICNQLVEQYPMVKSFVGGGEFTNFNTSNICQAMADELNSFLNQFIWESLGWSILFVIIGSFIVIRTIHHNRQRVRLRSHSSTSSSAATSRHHVSRHAGHSSRRPTGF